MSIPEPEPHLVRVEPVGLEIRVYAGETIFDAAYREGYDWPTVCAGQGTCTHCHIRILSGADSVSPICSVTEKSSIKRTAQRLYGRCEDGLRMACQVELEGDVTVEQCTFRGERLQ